MVHEEQKTKEFRTFGLLVGGVFSVIGLWPVVFRQEPARIWALGIGLGLIILAVIAPRSLKQTHRVWMRIGHALGWVNTRVLLGVIYYGLLTPMGITMRLFGWDPMRLRFEPKRTSYRVVRMPRSRSHMTRQF
jgi:hypothetical protein